MMMSMSFAMTSMVKIAMMNAVKGDDDDREHGDDDHHDDDDAHDGEAHA